MNSSAVIPVLQFAMTCCESCTPSHGTSPRSQFQTACDADHRKFTSARVSHTKVEVELKALKIPYTLIFPSSNWNSQGPRNRRIPVLSIRATDLWSNASGSVAEGACKNVKVSVMNWWNEAPPQVRSYTPIIESVI